MFVDASAITAFMMREPGSDPLLARLQVADQRMTSPIAFWEAAVAVARILDVSVAQAGQEVHDYLQLAEIAIVPLPVEAADLALDAFDRFGKGRHPARLNMGDCFAYACAKHYRQPLLYKGDDFARTDVAAA